MELQVITDNQIELHMISDDLIGITHVITDDLIKLHMTW